jgi:hypothetical protein
MMADFAEVSSMYSPTHPLAGDDIGAVAARGFRELAEVLHPFKLVSRTMTHGLFERQLTRQVYDDGTERLGCESARDRGELA